MYRIFIIFLTTGIILFPGCSNKNDNAKSGQNDSTAGNFAAKKSLEFNEFYFAGKLGKNYNIYKFIAKSRQNGIQEKNFSKFWSNRNEKVIKLSYSPDKKSLFFLTAGDFGKKAILPYVNNIKLYCINQDLSKAKFIKKIGSGLQVFTMWGQDNTFRIILNSFDRNSADFVNQQTFIFNGAGKSTAIYSKKFNITREGYPQITEKISLPSSPGSKYSIFAVDSIQTLIYLQSDSDGKVELITSTNQRLSQADWSSDEKYLVFSTINPSQKNKASFQGTSNNSKIFIYSIDKKKIIKNPGMEGITNFFIKGDLFIFDKGFQKNSFIEIINLKTLEPFYSIHLQDGCGLKSVL
jgi:Tol biopolymer transport system component